LSHHLQNGKAKESKEEALEKEKETLEKDYPLYQALTLLKGISIMKK